MQEDESDAAVPAASNDDSTGYVLQWQSVATEPAPAGFVWEEATLRSDTKNRSYSITHNPDFSPPTEARASYWGKLAGTNVNDTPPPLPQPTLGNPFFIPQHLYNSVAEAKAACEVHAATDAWLPSVEPSVEPNLPPLTIREHGNLGDDRDG